MVRENALEQGQGRSREIVLFGLFTALIAIGAFIRIPVPVCPFTLQLLFTTLAGLLLGSRKGALSVALYVLLGLVGVVYLFGMIYVYFINNFYIGKTIGVWAVILYCFLLAVPGDICLCILAAFLSKRLVKALGIHE